MSAPAIVSEILANADAAGLTLIAEGDRLKMKAAKEPPAELLAAIREHKGELLEALTAGPFGAAALSRLDPVDLIGRLELLYGGRLIIGAGGPRWQGRTIEPAPEIMAILKARRDEIAATLAARAEAVRHRRREPHPMSAADWQAFFNERAGIREFDGQLSRQEAERLALADCVAHWLARNSPAPSGPETCWQCGSAGDTDTLTSRVCRGGVFWLHGSCWAAFDAASHAEAIRALAGIIPGVIDR